MKLGDVLGEWAGRVEGRERRVRIERDAVHITGGKSDQATSLTEAKVEEQDGAVWFRGEEWGEEVSVVIRLGKSGGVQLSWLDGVFPFVVHLSRPAAVAPPPAAPAAGKRPNRASRRAARAARKAARAAPRPPRAPRDAATIFAALVRDIARGWDDDNPFAPGPRPERYRVELAALGAEAWPILVAELESEYKLRRVEAARALSRIWPQVPEEARAALQLAAERHPGEVGRWFFAADPEAGRALGLHRPPGPWPAVFSDALDRAPDLAGELLAELFEDAEVRRQLVTAEAKFHGLIDRLARVRPDLVPLAGLRELRSSEDPLLRDGAAAWLTHLNHPEDLRAALEATRRALLSAVDRLAPWPESDRLFAHFSGVERTTAEARYLAELVLRRRCAGLENPNELVVPMFAATLRSGKRYDQVVHTLRGAEALGDPRLDELARDARQRVGSGHSRELRRFSLEAADRMFAQGQCDTGTPGYCAYLAYAAELIEGASAHAAFQLAWIDRAFGAPSDDERTARIRALGFRDEGLLTAVARAPVHPLPGRRVGWRPRSVATQLNPRLLAMHAAVAEGAGLPGTAAAVFAIANERTGDHADDQARCAAAARAHLERVAAACR